MAKKKKEKKIKNSVRREKKPLKLSLPEGTKKYVLGITVFILALIVALSFFEKAGVAGEALFSGLRFLIGESLFLLPLILILGGMAFLNARYEKLGWPIELSTLLLVFGISGIAGSFDPLLKRGGWVGYLVTYPFLKFFGFWVTQIVFWGLSAIGSLIFWHLLRKPASPDKEEKKPSFAKGEEEKQSLIKRIFAPSFKVKEIEPGSNEKETKTAKAPEQKLKPAALPMGAIPYIRPTLDLLDGDRSVPSAGDIRQSSAIIKKTLENFDIPVEMSEINIGPTVTQYALKPADGIKLAKITVLSNDLALALSAHPIRIEAPIPGKPLVGVEVPNKVRAQVRLKELISGSKFQTSTNLTIPLGKDVSGSPIYADLARMPHMLVAGSTGTGKTIFLNNLITSLLYRNSPEILRFILIDPKRVEFPVYQDIPHLLAPVIFDPQKAVNSLKWLVSEMERRFGVLAAAKSRDIKSYNENASKNEEPIMPYILLVVDELADLMAAQGKDMEAGIVRLAQMARAVGIHLILATQRPSVEVITGLIKANITARVTFQVASQVDSRTVLDMAGAEKLLGAGDSLFISAEVTKPKRIQGAYVSDKEVKRVINFIKTQNAKLETKKYGEEMFENGLAQDLEKTLEMPDTGTDAFYGVGGDDPMYEEAKRVVTESKKASASLLQRRLRIGYARAARLLDMLEEKGVIGPGEGAKPREVYLAGSQSFNVPPLEDNEPEEEETDEEGDKWKKV